MAWTRAASYIRVRLIRAKIRYVPWIPKIFGASCGLSSDQHISFLLIHKNASVKPIPPKSQGGFGDYRYKRFKFCIPPNEYFKAGPETNTPNQYPGLATDEAPDLAPPSGIGNLWQSELPGRYRRQVLSGMLLWMTHHQQHCSSLPGLSGRIKLPTASILPTSNMKINIKMDSN